MKSLSGVLQEAREAQLKLRRTSRYLRSRVLSTLAQAVEDRRADFVKLLISEAGKPRALADGEVTRACVTLQGAAEEAKRFGGEVIPLDQELAGRAYAPAVSLWMPRGVVLAVTPFNFPLNLVVHKVGPALASGNAVLLKPSPHAPGCAQLLVELFHKALGRVRDTLEEFPVGALQLVQATNDEVRDLLRSPVVQTLSFTGSAEVGWALQGVAIRKKVLLELGGNAAVIVHRDADIERAAARIASGGFAYAGQTCISVQRVLVHEEVAERFERALVAASQSLGVGDPELASTVCGPLINDAAADRIQSWILDAETRGAQTLLRAEREGRVLSPTLLKNVPLDHPLWAEEAFGPVVALREYASLDEAIERVNDSRFGLQAGVFTSDLSVAQKAIDALEMGGVLVNEIPTYRADAMPYGGVKDSGLGREGMRYAMEEMSERKVIVHWQSG